jgi:hypothetical protein
VGLPYFLVFELLGPLAGVFGIPVVAVAFVTGAVSTSFLIAFSVVAILVGLLLSISALALEDLNFRRHARNRDVARLLFLAVVENLGYRQLNDVWRVAGLWDVARRRREWGEQRRRGFAPSTESAGA